MSASDVDRSVARFRRDLANRERVTFAVLEAHYRTALRSVRQELARLDLTAGARTTPAGRAFQRRRLTSLVDLTEREFHRYARLSAGLVDLERAHAASIGAEAGRQMILNGFGQPPPGAILPAVNINRQALIDLTAASRPDAPLGRLFASFGPDAAAAVESALASGLARGVNSRVIGRDIARVLGGQATRAQAIARTETHRAFRSASLATMRENRHLLNGWRWSAALSGRTCAACLSLHGRIFDLDEPPRMHVNCFPAGTMVSGPPVVGSTTRWYDGDLVEISLSSGAFLAVTPNHPILTPQGWIAAGALHEGGDVLRSLDTQRILAAVNPHNHDSEALIEDVAESLGGASFVRSEAVKSTTEDFHGDGIDGQVSIVRTDGLLWDALDATIRKPSLQDQFGGRRVGLSSLTSPRAPDAFLDGNYAATSGRMGSSSGSASFFGRETGGAESVCVGCGATLNARASEPSGNHASRDIERLGKRFFRLTGDIASHDLSIGQPQAGASRSPGFLAGQLTPGVKIAEQTTRFEFIAEAFFPNMKPSGRDLGALTANIGPDRILKINRRSFQGHVYNLQTTHGWYIANGIITHNCRCSVAPVTKSWRDLGVDVPESLPRRQTGADWFAKQPATLQRKVLGPGGFAEYTAGRVQLADFVGLKRSTVWGSSYQRGSLTGARARAAKRTAVTVATSPRDVPSFRPAKNLSAAENYARSLGVPDVTYRETGRRLDAQRTQQALDAANALNETLSMFMGRGLPIPARIRVQRDVTNAYAYYRAGDRSLTVNSLKWRNMDREMRYIRDADYMVAREPTDLLVHEMGHFMHHRNAPSDWVNRAKVALTPTQETTARQLSRYAATSRGEFVAEVFTQLIRGRSVSDEAMALYREFGGFNP